MIFQGISSYRFHQDLGAEPKVNSEYHIMLMKLIIEIYQISIVKIYLNPTLTNINLWQLTIKGVCI